MRSGSESLLANGFRGSQIHIGSWESRSDNSGLDSFLVAQASPGGSSGGALGQYTIQDPLPSDPVNWVKTSAFDVAWPQIAAFCAAAVGIVGTVAIIKAFVGRGT